MPSATDLAYAAGVVDSDGAISITRKRRKSGFDSYCIRVDVAMTSPYVPLWIHSKFGGSYFDYTQREGHKKIHRVNVCANQAAAMLKALLPYLLEKRSRAELAIQLQALASPRGVHCVSPDVIRQRDGLFLDVRKINKSSGRSGINQYSRKELFDGCSNTK